MNSNRATLNGYTICLTKVMRTKNCTARHGIHTYELLARDTAEFSKTTHATVMALGYNCIVRPFCRRNYNLWLQGIENTISN